MNKLIILFGLLVLIVLISGCGQTQTIQPKTQTSVCNSPYIQVGTSCCIDQNSNSICDNDETPLCKYNDGIELIVNNVCLCGNKICSIGSSCIENHYCVNHGIAEIEKKYV